MKRIYSILLAWFLAGFLGGATGYSQTANPPPEPPQAAAPALPSNQVQATPPAPATYTLSPERRAQAIAYSRSLYILYFVGTLLSLCIYFLLWRARLAVKFRDWARRVSQRHIIQCLIVVPLFVLVVTLLNLPLEFYAGYVLEHRFGFSNQTVFAWLSDWGKALLIVAVAGVMVAWVFYTAVRRSPRRWWFYFWLVSIPLILAFMLIEPYVIEPLFDKFTLLEKSQPVLAGRIEDMLKHAGLSIPPERIFEMDASSRTNAMNAYVSGLGASKRVVVWDTTLKKMGPDELVLVLGHEAGHYVLHHIPKEFILDEAVALFFFYLGFHAVIYLVKRWGVRSGVEGVGDLASLPFVLAVLTLLVFLSAPLVDGISRYYEHQADQFGLEVAYGIVPDPNAAEAHALQILGDVDLSDPDPNPFIKFWLYTHPPLDERIRFAATYKPWAEGKPLELLPKGR